MTPTLGIDPGGQWTGIVVRDGRELLHHQLLSRADLDSDDMDAWLDLHHRVVTGLLADHDANVAIEGVVHPTPHMGLTNVGPLLDTAQVLGMVRSHWDSTVVRPNGFGRPPTKLLKIKGKAGLEACHRYLVTNYPPELIGRTRRGKDDDLQHLRSAWDVAGRGKSAQERFGVSA